MSETSVLPAPAPAAQAVAPKPDSDPADPGTTGAYTIRQAADMTGLSEHTLRYYERARLLGSVRRERSSRHRRYSAQDIARLRTLACLRAAGMPLDRMRRYFALAVRGADAAPQQRALLMEQREVLEERLRDLQSHLRYLDDKIAWWEAVGAGDTERASDLLQRMTGHLRTLSTE